MKVNISPQCREAELAAFAFEWQLIANVILNGGKFTFRNRDSPSPLQYPVENIVVEDRPEGLVDISANEQSLVISGPKPLRQIIGTNALQMSLGPSLAGTHVHIDCCILPNCISETSLFMIWQRLAE